MAQVVPRCEGDAANKKAQRGGKDTRDSKTEWPDPKGRIETIRKKEKERTFNEASRRDSGGREKNHLPKRCNLQSVFRRMLRMNVMCSCHFCHFYSQESKWAL